MKPLILCGLLAATVSQAAWAANTCQVASSPTPPTILELYTSEGCSSCPPADKYVSTLKGRSDVLTLAFHVDYWDKLGWTDRFATRESTARQYALAEQAGRSGVYTPQLVLNGRDWRDWGRLPKAAAAAAAPVGVTLVRDGETVSAQVSAAAGSGAPARLSGYWAVLEDDHESKVRSGENAGETLKHDAVVRLYKPVAAWAAADGSKTQLSVSRGVADHPRRVAFVVTDAGTLRPVQVAVLGC